ncbi:MAG TPA: DUF4097 family beta strand repeat-containing protein [Vicinamibacterales bacterium]|nr:DUF4097 family beta strand repeat-containing protein [Vicinamibacterales bacterium]
MRILTASVLLVTLAIPVPAAAQWKETETIDRTVYIGQNGRLKLNNFSGDIRIVGTSGNDVVIRAVRRATRQRLDNIRLEIEVSGTNLSIESNRRVPGWREQNDNVVETSFDIQVPHGTELDIHSFSGKVDIRGVTGQIQAETFSGDIELDVAAAPQLPAVTAGTFSGDIRARVPAHASGRVRFDSFSGSIRSDLPISMTKFGGRRADIDAEIGTGQGPTIRFKTFSGDLRIVK